MDQLPQLFSRLHSSQPSLVDRESQPLNVSRRNYFRSKSGRSLYVSICNMHQHISQNPDWFEKQLAPSGNSSASSRSPPVSADAAPSPPPKAHCSSTSSQPEQRFDSGLVLNEVVVKTPSLESGKGALGRNMLLLAPGASASLTPGPSHSPSPPPGLCPSPELPHCSLSLQEETSRLVFIVVQPVLKKNSKARGLF